MQSDNINGVVQKTLFLFSWFQISIAGFCNQLAFFANTILLVKLCVIRDFVDINFVTLKNTNFKKISLICHI